MKALLICPDDAPNAAFFTLHAPQALCPLLGRTALDRTLAAVCARGAKEVIILCADRPAEVRATVGDGKRWGLRRVEVRPISREPSLEEARALCQGEGWLPQPFDVVRVSGWPAQEVEASCENAKAWFDALFDHLQEAGSHAVGMRELEPGVWVGTHARIAPTAKLFAPCWIGKNTVIGEGATVGPRVVVESKALVDEGVELMDSMVGPATYVGAFTELRRSLAWGNMLLDWSTGSLTEVPDAFLLGDLSRRVRREHSHLIFRLLALIVLVLTSPILLSAWWEAQHKGEELWQERRAVCTPVRGGKVLTRVRTIPWYNLNGVGPIARRWPELWNVVLGHFTWVGNRPLTPAQAAELHSDFEQLWLATPSGLISLADAEGSADCFGDDTKAHAAFYSASRSWRTDLSIIVRSIKRLRDCPNGAPISPIHPQQPPKPLPLQHLPTPLPPKLIRLMKSSLESNPEPSASPLAAAGSAVTPLPIPLP